MDTSKEYILMCEKAIDISDRKFQYGDYVYATYKKDWDIKEEDDNFFFFHKDLASDWVQYKLIWLPRQDQLQTIILEGQEHEKCTKAEKLGVMFDRLFQVSEILEWYGINYGYDGDEFDSMEQLWLAFVMKEKYNKIWNGKDWEQPK